jgi:smad nuclear-interacting protein 1
MKGEVKEERQSPDRGRTHKSQSRKAHGRHERPSFKVKEEPRSSPENTPPPRQRHGHTRNRRSRSPVKAEHPGDSGGRIRDGDERRDRKRRHEDHHHSSNPPSNSREVHDNARVAKRERQRSLSPGEIEEPPSRWGPSSADLSAPTGEPVPPKEAPSLGLSGALAKETNTYRGVVINYSEPPEAKIPKKRWRLYPFKESEEFKPLYIHRQTAYLIGRDRRICDMPLLHPSISKQHAVIQYRSVPYTKVDGTQSRAIRPYVIDLNSPNGTSLNGNPIQSQKYYELKEKDVLKFGFSSRDYVLLHEKSARDVDSDS